MPCWVQWVCTTHFSKSEQMDKDQYNEEKKFDILGIVFLLTTK